MQTLHTFGTKGKSEASFDFRDAMSDFFGVTPLQQHGGRRPGAGRPRKGEVRPPKRPSPPRTGSDYILGRLTRDAADGVRNAAILLEGINKGLISPWAAGVEMSYVRRREVNGRGSENMAKARDWALHKLFNPHRKSKHMQENAPDVASSARGEEERQVHEPEQSNAATAILK
jgi:hypothetical protein